MYVDSASVLPVGYAAALGYATPLSVEAIVGPPVLSPAYQAQVIGYGNPYGVPGVPSIPLPYLRDEDDDVSHMRKRRSNSNTQKDIQQIGQGNMNLQGNIQQVNRRQQQIQFVSSSDIIESL